MRYYKHNKYSNKKVTYNGQTFDSQREAKRYQELLLLERAGIISDLQTQVEFELLPAHFEEVPTGEFYKRGPKKGQLKMKRVCVEQSVKYVADFVYYENGKKVVEDAKGYRDPSSAGYAKFVLKRKMMLHIHGIRIKEV